MSEGWLAVRWLHLLAMAFFVGGQILLVVAVVPVERRAPDQERLRTIARRFGYGTLAAIGVLLATGAAMASRFESWGDSTLHVSPTASGKEREKSVCPHHRRCYTAWVEETGGHAIFLAVV